MRIPKIPQQNGVAKRMNRTIKEKIKYMLYDGKLPKSFLVKAICAAIDLISLSPSAPLDGDVLERV